MAYTTYIQDDGWYGIVGQSMWNRAGVERGAHESNQNGVEKKKSKLFLAMSFCIAKNWINYGTHFFFQSPWHINFLALKDFQ